MKNDWDTPIRDLAVVPPGLPDAPAVAQASLWSCTGCGSQASLEQIKSEGFLSCCPERKMAPPVPSADREATRPENCATADAICHFPSCVCVDAPGNIIDPSLPSTNRDSGAE